MPRPPESVTAAARGAVEVCACGLEEEVRDGSGRGKRGEIPCRRGGLGGGY